MRAVPADLPSLHPDGGHVRLQPDDRDHPPVCGRQDRGQRDLGLSSNLTVHQAARSPKTQVASRARGPALARAGLVVAIVVGLDQLTKHTIAAGISPGDTKKFLPAINLVHVRNTGVAFGVLSGGGAVVLVFTLIALVALVAFLAARPE